MNQNVDSRIHIALSPGDLTDDYNRHAGATLLSILKNSSSGGNDISCFSSRGGKKIAKNWNLGIDKGNNQCYDMGRKFIKRRNYKNEQKSSNGKI